MSDDSKIELLKQRRLLEMRRRLLLERAEAMKEEEQEKLEKEKGEEKEQEEKVKLGPKGVLKKRFVGRAWEVWNTAEAQYPEVTERIAGAMVSLIEAGRLSGPITGEQLYSFFRRVGLRVRLKTKIRIYESGELKSIADKLREE
jgi:DNA-binding TFAR19-related protein (PDSD5 family)